VTGEWGRGASDAREKSRETKTPQKKSTKSKKREPKTATGGRKMRHDGEAHSRASRNVLGEGGDNASEKEGVDKSI